MAKHSEPDAASTAPAELRFPSVFRLGKSSPALPPLESLPLNHRQATLDQVLDIVRRGWVSFWKEECHSFDWRQASVHWSPFFWCMSIASSSWLLKRWLVRRCIACLGSYDGLWCVLPLYWRGIGFCVEGIESVPGSVTPVYRLCTPESWNSATGPRPILFPYGLGFGLTQYIVFMARLLRAASDHPILIPLRHTRPHVGRRLSHSRFLKPKDRHEITTPRAELVRELGWILQKNKYTTNAESEIKKQRQPPRNYRLELA
ncbi:hypothetical protein BV22DRAFT_1129752 [Leucogyrophana mollusca]|uniref:Uncharacterized protein n=1 Tax=Leucogyrophana mollusca TaxID=85980 RepID=A0ACB8BGA8_9AGAM|nr:hypothetical protein BV22DRAFT_1129752 [Leucogyrophana mollusca]